MCHNPSNFSEKVTFKLSKFAIKLPTNQNVVDYAESQLFLVMIEKLLAYLEIKTIIHLQGTSQAIK